MPRLWGGNKSRLGEIIVELYLYIEYAGDTLPIEQIMDTAVRWIKPIIWAQKGRYGWISKEQVQNLYRRKLDMTKQQRGYTKVEPLDLVFHWDDTTPLDPITVELMRKTCQ